jgi:hypothetical protein
MGFCLRIRYLAVCRLLAVSRRRRRRTGLRRGEEGEPTSRNWFRKFKARRAHHYSFVLWTQDWPDEPESKTHPAPAKPVLFEIAELFTG